MYIYVYISAIYFTPSHTHTHTLTPSLPHPLTLTPSLPHTLTPSPPHSLTDSPSPGPVNKELVSSQIRSRGGIIVDSFVDRKVST